MTSLDAHDLLDIYSYAQREASETSIFTAIKRTLVAGSPAIALSQDAITGKIMVSAPFTNVLSKVFTDGVTLIGDGTPTNPIRRI